MLKGEKLAYHCLTKKIHGWHSRGRKNTFIHGFFCLNVGHASNKLISSPVRQPIGHHYFILQCGIVHGRAQNNFVCWGWGRVILLTYSTPLLAFLSKMAALSVERRMHLGPKNMPALWANIPLTRVMIHVCTMFKVI